MIAEDNSYPTLTLFSLELMLNAALRNACFATSHSWTSSLSSNAGSDSVCCFSRIALQTDVNSQFLSRINTTVTPVGLRCA